MEKLFERIAYGIPPGIKGLPLKALFFPLLLASIIYGLITRAKLLLYKAGLITTRRVRAKVISVGNITVGGTGKTPTTEFIAGELQKRGYSPAILSRGYGGKRTEKVNIVSDGKDLFMGPEEAGDEPFMMAKRLKGVPVLVGTERYNLAMEAERRFAADVFLLDDGFQHVRMGRDLDIVLFDGGKGTGNGSLTPMGPLREPASSLSRSGMVLINKSGNKDSGIEALTEKYSPKNPIFKSSYNIKCLRNIESGEAAETDIIEGKKVTALCGIANPASFIKTLEAAGGKIASQCIFPDHHDYTDRDMEDIMAQAASSGSCAVITTEKDAVKIDGMKTAFEIPVYSLDIELDLLGKESEFIDYVIEKAGLSEK